MRWNEKGSDAGVYVHGTSASHRSQEGQTVIKQRKTLQIPCYATSYWNHVIAMCFQPYFWDIKCPTLGLNVLTNGYIKFINTEKVSTLEKGMEIRPFVGSKSFNKSLTLWWAKKMCPILNIKAPFHKRVDYKL